VSSPPLFQHQNAFHTYLPGTGGSEHSVVGLGTAGGEDNIRPSAPGICQKKLQLADLVATQGYASHVIPLNVNILPDLPAQVFQLIQGRGQLSEGNSGKINNLFHKNASFGCTDQYTQGLSFPDSGSILLAFAVEFNRWIRFDYPTS